jgi:UDP-N-acetyl-D-glucosamine dehydrogenase
MAARLLTPGTLVVLESTTYPGTTEEIVRPILEKGSGLTAGGDFWLAYAPERIDPGNKAYGLRNTPRVVGGVTPSCTRAAAAFCSRLCDEVVQAASPREAEMAKLLENTYRHVNIALVNETAIFCRELGVDLRDAIRCAATKPFGFQPFFPGPGAGGHCIPVDPSYLTCKVRTLGYPFRLAELAREINSQMPAYVIERASEVLRQHGQALSSARVLLLGVTYKKDSADMRESPAIPVARGLRAAGAIISFTDPHISEWLVDGKPVENAGTAPAAGAADLAILLQAHSEYALQEIGQSASLLLDTRGAVPWGEQL